MMVQDMLMVEKLKKGYGELVVSSKTCENHSHKLTYPVEYTACPSCGSN